MHVELWFGTTREVTCGSRSQKDKVTVLNSANKHHPAKSSKSESSMDQTPTINVLIVADLLADGERLVTLLRKSGFSVHAEAVRDEEFLRGRLLHKTWDLLFMCADNLRLTFERLQAVLQELELDLPCIGLGFEPTTQLSLETIADNVSFSSVTNLEDAQQCALLIRQVRHELNSLQERRELRRSTAALRDLQQRYQMLLESSAEAIGYLHDGVHLYANPAYAALFGYADAEALRSVAFLDLVQEQDVAAVQQFLRAAGQASDARCVFHALTAGDTVTRLSMECALVTYGEERSIQIIVRPLTGNLDQQQRARALQSKDLVTDLLNRSALLTRIEEAIAAAIYDHQHSALLLFRLNGFDDFVALAGRPASNLLLADAARILEQTVPAQAVAGRSAENEFAVLLPVARGADSERLLGSMRLTLNEELQGRQPAGAPISVTAGSAVVNDLAPTAEVILERARHNLTVGETAKLSNQAAPDAYGTPGQMFERLGRALMNEDFVLVFQPVVSLKEDRVERYEIRIRLRDKDQLIYPPRFLELANQHGLGEKIDRWVTEKSLQLLQERDDPNLQLTITLTQNSISSTDFLPWLTQQLSAMRLSANRIVLQVSELDIISAPERLTQFCSQLRELQIPLSITHFGCTLSPFQYLPNTGVNFVKLDKSLLDNIGTDPAQREKLKTIVDSLHARGVLVIAPMIDHIDVLPLLWEADVNFVQGNCLQEPSDKMDFSFVQDEEITLDSFY